MFNTDYQNYKPSFKRRLKEKISPFCYPAEEFERRYGITGISREYIMPHPFDNKTMEFFLYEKIFPGLSLYSRNTQKPWPGNDAEFETIHQTALHLVDSIIELNPELKIVRWNRKDFAQLCNLIRGIVSKFNAGDLDYYFSTESDRNPPNEKARLRSEKVSYLRMKTVWSPSIETLEKIDAQISAKVEDPTEENKLKYMKSCPKTERIDRVIDRLEPYFRIAESEGSFADKLTQSVRQFSRSGQQSR